MSGMAAKTLYQTPLPTWTVLKSVDAKALTATGILTFPEYDYDGDWVQPDGGTWPATPYANLEHQSPKIGWGSVEMKALPDVGTIPVGTTHFDPRNRASSQAFALVAEGVKTGLSLEYTPVGPVGGPYWKSLGHPSPRLDRDAMEFTRWKGLGWAHCARPVQPNAQLLLPDYPEYEKAIRIVEVGRIGSEPLDGIIRKSLDAMVAQVRRPTTVRGGYDKAMGGGIYADDPTATADDEQDQQTMDGPTPTVRAYKNLAQGILDLIERFEADMDQSEHTGAIGRMDQDVARIQQFAEEMNGFGDDVADDVAGKMKRPTEGLGDDEEAEDELGDETDPDRTDVAIDDEEPPAEDNEPSPPKKAAKKKPPFGKALAVDATGAIITKSYPGYVPQRFGRFRATDFRPVETAEVDPIPDDPDAEKKALLEAAEKRLRRAERKAAPFLTASTRTA